MRTFLLLGWLLVPVGFGIWHYGPGQDYLTRDDASRMLAQADALVKEGDWAAAVDAYDEALKLLPPDMVAAQRRVRLEKAKAQMMASQLPTALADLKVLAEELQGDLQADKKLVADTRESLAQAHYYMTWLMRLEGLTRDVWEPEVEAARQNYRLLAEEAQKRGDEEAATKSREDLEAAVRLARMELSELQGLPLPSQ
jgi:tetratricopeptide (TPR) repeat protein